MQGVLARMVYAPRWDMNATQPRLHDLRLSIRNEVLFQFTWYQNEISYQSEDFIRNENRNDLIQEWLVREQHYISAKFRLGIMWTGAKKYMDMDELVPEWKSFRYYVNRPWI